ncbi:hypothetical protein COS93_00750 [bacterium (Candidatus Gribaldobacteria) CG07_land_8_20_14_0_80_33_18]|uniref:Homing endonuclease LAGLIDADG domain-containing protein n=1 Tax=bacterium (Candidatus Gribaldobacteria) CG07_land_8_20_14_0_80_33_18 TaxID=2014272 RepID=A0A2M6Z3V5_9BACT|nr:MAG: hypothetical protein COS93_00750 [bacterium (Candidatus Gribaldobacteria) CG07_land_8_20_14_0_80_33_18]PJA00386.1 MAG: hypothetical protein COX75_02485 [bacterium (Candidatus Gribaldobacteria) CG_4_10_14_0_2_um_filter_33_15]PJB08975.1 MAG: hypothetical protein CO122_00540 [bacterium (Candidatus Gribaldobacteria) CG_4_9_14_3_um_filter_33_9]
MIKTSYGKVKRLSTPESAYIAALIDGEGTISLTRHNKSGYRRPEVGISNTELKLLKWIKNLIGAGQISLKRSHNKKHAMCYTYKICNRQAFNLLAQISSYLRTYKRKRAKLILKNYKKLTLRNGKYSQKLLKQKKRLVEKFFAISPFGKRNRIEDYL